MDEFVSTESWLVKQRLLAWFNFILATLLVLFLFRSAYIYVPVILLLVLISSKFFNTKMVILFVSLCMAGLAFDKELVGDLAEYSRIYDFAKTVSISEALASNRSDISVRRAEVLFRLYNWTFSSFGVTFSFFHSATVFLCYGLMTSFGIKLNYHLGHHRFENRKKNQEIDIAFTLVWVILIAVTFTLTSQVMRQYLAISIFAAGISFSFNSAHKAYVIPTLLASVLVHNSLLVLLAVYVFSILTTRYLNRLSIKFIFLLLALIGGSLLPYWLGPLATVFSYGGLEKSSLSITAYLDSILILTMLWASRFGKYSYFSALLINFTILFCCSLLFFREVPILFLRLYFFMDIFRVVAGLFIYQSFDGRARAIMLVFLIFLGPIYWTLKLLSSGWDYGWYTSSDLLYKALGS